MTPSPDPTCQPLSVDGPRPEGRMEREADAGVSKRGESQPRGVPWARIWPGGWIVLVILAAIYAPIVRSMIRQWWDDPNYSHGFMVPVFSGFLIWQRRAELVALAPQASWIGLPVLLTGIGALVL